MTDARDQQLDLPDPGLPRPSSIPIAMRDPRLRRDLTQLGSDLRGDLRFHQLARDQHDRFAHEILQTTVANLHDDIGNPHPLTLGHRGAPSLGLREQTEELGRHGGQNHLRRSLHQPMLEPRHHRFEHAAIETHGMATRPQRQPVQINASNGLTAAGTRLLNVVNRHPSKGSHDRTGSILSCGRSQDLARSETRCLRQARP